MDFFGVLLLVIFVVSAILMVLLILIQDEQGDVMGGVFGGGSSTPFGSRSGNILTRTTTILGVIFLASSFLLAFNFRTQNIGNIGDTIKAEQPADDWWNKKTPEAPVAAPVTAPTDGAVAPAGDAKALEAPAAGTAPVAPVTPAPAAVPVKP